MATLVDIREKYSTIYGELIRRIQFIKELTSLRVPPRHAKCGRAGDPRNTRALERTHAVGMVERGYCRVDFG